MIYDHDLETTLGPFPVGEWSKFPFCFNPYLLYLVRMFATHINLIL